jgi:hypothetical protein
LCAVDELEFELSPELEEAPVTPGAFRQRRYRERHKTSLSVTGDAHNVTGDAKESPPYPQKKNNITPTEAKTLQYPQTSKRGSRLPENWRPSDDLWAWAKEKLGINDEFLRFETGAFRDHFWAAPGQRGVKINWNSTWKNWMREAVRRRGNGHCSPGNQTSPMMRAVHDLIAESEENDRKSHDEPTLNFGRQTRTR